MNMAVINISVYLNEEDLLKYTQKKTECNDAARKAFKKELKRQKK